MIHAGIHYPPNSLKAEMCVRGNELLYSYCSTRSVPHSRVGKLVVARERAPLLELLRLGERNGARDLAILSSEEAREMEPAVSCGFALHSPSTGIVDSHLLMLSLLGEAEDAGAVLALESRARLLPNLTVEVDGWEVRCEGVVNCAGLHAGEFCPTVRQYFAKGNYFRMRGKPPFERLVYPLPSPGGLGIHATLDLSGACVFGPDVEWIDAGKGAEEVCFDVDEERADAFYREIREYFPGLEDGALFPDYAGVRPKLGHPRVGGDLKADFLVLGKEHHGVEGLVHLLGIESPGLTSSLALGERVANMLCN